MNDPRPQQVHDLQVLERRKLELDVLKQWSDDRRSEFPLLDPSHDRHAALIISRLLTEGRIVVEGDCDE